LRSTEPAWNDSALIDLLRPLRAGRLSLSRKLAGAFLLSTLAILSGYRSLGLYTVQPLGAVPEGQTYLVWRAAGEPFFNSIDGTCDRWGEEVTVSCRGRAIRRAPFGRLLVAAPYQDWAYRMSVQTHTYERRGRQPDDGRCAETGPAQRAAGNARRAG
jgi:hypothetical protein